ncbi:MAG: hypothetical protein AB2792_20475 [Candidatus Thiodiazotropha sp.]
MNKYPTSLMINFLAQAAGEGKAISHGTLIEYIKVDLRHSISCRQRLNEIDAFE